jgi:hypothetical protein
MDVLAVMAQKVLDAYRLAPIEDELTAAAVLRNAVVQIQEAVPHSPGGDLWQSAFCEGVSSAQATLLVIADELEAMSTDIPV